MKSISKVLITLSTISSHSLVFMHFWIRMNSFLYVRIYAARLQNGAKQWPYAGLEPRTFCYPDKCPQPVRPEKPSPLRLMVSLKHWAITVLLSIGHSLYTPDETPRAKTKNHIDNIAGYILDWVHRYVSSTSRAIDLLIFVVTHQGIPLISHFCFTPPAQLFNITRLLSTAHSSQKYRELYHFKMHHCLNLISRLYFTQKISFISIWL